MFIHLYVIYSYGSRSRGYFLFFSRLNNCGVNSLSAPVLITQHLNMCTIIFNLRLDSTPHNSTHYYSVKCLTCWCCLCLHWTIQRLRPQNSCLWNGHCLMQFLLPHKMKFIFIFINLNTKLHLLFGFVLIYSQLKMTESFQKLVFLN